MKKILFTFVFCAAACLATAFAQTAATSARVDTIAPSPRDGDSLMPGTMVLEDAPVGGRPVDFRLEDDENLYYFTHKSTLPLPDDIRNLLIFGKTEEAISQLEAYKKNVKTKDPLLLLLLELDFYEQIRYDENFGKKYEETLQKIKAGFGNRAETIRLEIDELGISGNFSPQKAIEIADRMIKADAKYLPAYFIRGQEYFNLDQTDKFCEDFDKLPEAIQNLNGNYKQTCKK